MKNVDNLMSFSVFIFVISLSKKLLIQLNAKSVELLVLIQGSQEIS